MSHISSKEAYKRLEERINRFPQGAPPSKTLYKILSMLFSEKEAELWQCYLLSHLLLKLQVLFGK